MAAPTATRLAAGARRAALLACAALAGAAAGGAHGAEAAARFPTKPVRIIVPFPPGGSNDILGRFIGLKLSERLGQQTVIDNRAGADGIIGTDIAARATPDGYTLLIVSTSYTMNPAIHKLPYDPERSLAPVATIGTGPNVLATHPGLPAATLKEFIALAKAKPGHLRYASSGIGGFNHFGGELFKAMAGIDLVHVPYKGGGPAMVDVMAGQVELLVGTLIQGLPHIRAGRLRPLGVGGARRSPSLPEVPTIAEAGVPGYDGSIWWGLLAPAGVPPAIVARLNAEIAAILRDPDTAKRLTAEAAEPLISSPQEFRRLIADDLAKWKKVALGAGIKATH
jgi:tripartite-type tricarboxylate transporter receptor subunit TctC